MTILLNWPELEPEVKVVVTPVTLTLLVDDDRLTVIVSARPVPVIVSVLPDVIDAVVRNRRISSS